MGVKQVLVIRNDLGMRKGKMIAQGAHASLAVFFDRIMLHNFSLLSPPPEKLTIYGTWSLKNESEVEWIEGLFTKICVRVDSEKELLEIYQKAKESNLLCSLVTDAGKTEFNGVPTKTCCAIGPDEESKIDAITGHLRLL